MNVLRKILVAVLLGGLCGTSVTSSVAFAADKKTTKKSVDVKSYTKKDGTKVSSHKRAAPGFGTTTNSSKKKK